MHTLGSLGYRWKLQTISQDESCHLALGMLCSTVSMMLMQVNDINI